MRLGTAEAGHSPNQVSGVRRPAGHNGVELVRAHQSARRYRGSKHPTARLIGKCEGLAEFDPDPIAKAALSLLFDAGVKTTCAAGGGTSDRGV